LTSKEAAELLRTKVGTLANKRVKGEGPPFVKFGSKVLYEVEALTAWLKAANDNQSSDK
jgi:hypothetical protein